MPGTCDGTSVALTAHVRVLIFISSLFFTIPALAADDGCDPTDTRAESVFRLVSRATELPLWETDYEHALNRALAEDAVVIIHIGAQWCGPCVRMKREVLSERGIKTAASLRRVVLLELDMDDDAKLVKALGVTGPPVDLVLTWNPKRKKWQITKRVSGFKSVATYMQLIRKNAPIRKRGN